MFSASLNLSTATGDVVQVRHFRCPGVVPARNGRWLAIGVFDGVHLGHQAVLGAARDAAREHGASLGAVVFDPHPRAVLGGGVGPALLQTSWQRASTLARYGAKEVFEVRFDLGLSRMSAADFCRLLVEAFALRGASVGADFRFGRGQGGDVPALEDLGRRMGFGVRAAPQVSRSGDIVSSTSIRRRVADGDVEGANRLLGRPYQLTGMVAGAASTARVIEARARIALAQPGLLPVGAYVANLRREGRGRYPGLLLVEGAGPDEASFACAGAYRLAVGSAVTVDVLRPAEAALAGVA